MTDVLLIDTDTQRSQHLIAILSEHGYSAGHGAAWPNPDSTGALRCVVGLDNLPPPASTLLQQLPVVILSAAPSIRAAVDWIKQGAEDYLPLPVEPQDLIAAVERATTQHHGSARGTLQQFPMIGSSPAMQALKDTIEKVAPTSSTVLIQGPSGTGKELVARAIHAGSDRSTAPLISINCATIPADLIEVELFGFERFDGINDSTEAGAGNRRGLVDAAEGGTLLLDEIAELPLPAQARLLRVVQGENRRVGSSSTQAVNVRVIAATHRNLGEATQNGQFREDLYYRLNVVCLDLPPLRERARDVLEIAQWLLLRTAERLNKQGLTFSAEAEDTILKYHWPGNVRELENAIERAVILADNHAEVTQALLAVEPNPDLIPAADPALDPDQTSLEDYFVRFVVDNQDQLTETELAEKLGISRKSLWERRQRLNIPRTKTRKRGPRRDTTDSQ